MNLAGEFKGIFFTDMFKDQLEALEHLDENLFIKATLHLEFCTGLQIDLPLVDFIRLKFYDEE